jgi:hypothetical protein
MNGKTKKQVATHSKKAYRLEIREIAADKAAFFTRANLSERELRHLIRAFCAELKVPNPFESSGSTL